MKKLRQLWAAFSAASAIWSTIKDRDDLSLEDKARKIIEMAHVLVDLTETDKDDWLVQSMETLIPVCVPMWYAWEVQDAEGVYDGLLDVIDHVAELTDGELDDKAVDFLVGNDTVKAIVVAVLNRLFSGDETPPATMIMEESSRLDDPGGMFGARGNIGLDDDGEEPKGSITLILGLLSLGVNLIRLWKNR